MTAPRWIVDAIEACESAAPGVLHVDQLPTALIERLPLEALRGAVQIKAADAQAVYDAGPKMWWGDETFAPPPRVIAEIVGRVVCVLTDGDPEVVELTELYQDACRALDDAGVPHAQEPDDGPTEQLNLAARIRWLAQQRPTRLDLQRVEAEREVLRNKVDEIYASERALTVERDRARDHLVAIDLVLKAAGISLETRRDEGDLTTAVQALATERDAARKLAEDIDGNYQRSYGNAMLVLNNAKVPLQIAGRHISLADRIAWMLADQQREIAAARSEAHTVGEFIRAAHEELTIAGVPQSPTDSQHMLDSALARRVRALRDERDHLQKMYEGASDDLNRERSAHQEAEAAASNREIALAVDRDNARMAAKGSGERVTTLEDGIRSLVESDMPAGDLRRALAGLIGIDQPKTEREHRIERMRPHALNALGAKVADQAAYIEQLEAEIDALEDEIWEDAP